MFELLRRFLKKRNGTNGYIVPDEPKYVFQEIANDKIIFIKASLVKEIYDHANPHFWNHHGNDHNGYIELAQRSMVLYSKWLSGYNVTDLLNDEECCGVALEYLAENQIIKVYKYPDGMFSLAGDGRHRVAAAQELDVYVPVKIVGVYLKE